MSASLELDECLKDNVIGLFMKPRFDKGSAGQKAADTKLKLEIKPVMVYGNLKPLYKF